MIGAGRSPDGVPSRNVCADLLSCRQRLAVAYPAVARAFERTKMRHSQDVMLSSGGGREVSLSSSVSIDGGLCP
jgi:hypothetical protein